ncbi:MAG TPA: pentapeptide repeat-containing protein [Gaiellaceae bacterium]|jgi:uncharacterized protein YjbI with pentapeptide repeats|nr:pentapeptide repeat-containing protein [Gaiellaceae bacterium]
MAAFVFVPAGESTQSADPPCKPGSGVRLAHHKLTAADFSSPADVRCAYLAEDDLAGFDLGQVDLSGADLSGANLQGTDLIQATLSGAKLDGADLTGAKLGQATAPGASFAGAKLVHADLGQATLEGSSFAGADLSHADLTQATLTNANLEGADLSHADLTQATLTHADFDRSNLSDVSFTQAQLGGASFHGAKGIAPWSVILLVLAAIVLGLLLVWFVRSVVRGRRPVGSAGFFLGLAGVLIVVLGVHLTIGGFVGEIAGDFGPQIRETCSTGVFCTIGLRSGFTGLWAGILALVAGFVVIAKSS